MITRTVCGGGGGEVGQPLGGIAEIAADEPVQSLLCLRFMCCLQTCVFVTDAGCPCCLPSQIRGTLRRGDKVLDSCNGNWLHYLEWEGGVGEVRLCVCMSV